MILIKTNYPNDTKKCKRFIQGIVMWKLAPCVNRINNVKSFYVWEGKFVNNIENILFIKTLPEKKEKLISYIHKNHPYDTPEICIIEVDECDPKYLDWMRDYLNK